MHTEEELEYRRKRLEEAKANLDLSIEERIYKKICDYEGIHTPNTVFLGSQIIFKLRMNILVNKNYCNTDIGDIKISTIYGLRVIEVHSKPDLINVAYIKDL